jgi:hypothetical protein
MFTRSLVIYSDIDGVIADVMIPALSWLWKQYGIRMCERMIKYHSMERSIRETMVGRQSCVYPMQTKMWEQLWSDHRIYEKAIPIFSMIQALEDAERNRCQVKLITQRGEKMARVTAGWLADYTRFTNLRHVAKPADRANAICADMHDGYFNEGYTVVVLDDRALNLCQVSAQLAAREYRGPRVNLICIKRPWSTDGDEVTPEMCKAAGVKFMTDSYFSRKLMSGQLRRQLEEQKEKETAEKKNEQFKEVWWLHHVESTYDKWCGATSSGTCRLGLKLRLVEPYMMKPTAYCLSVDIDAGKDYSVLEETVIDHACATLKGHPARADIHLSEALLAQLRSLSRA